MVGGLGRGAASILLQGGRIIDPSQGIDAVGDVFISDGKIVGLSLQEAVSPPESCLIVRAQGLVVCPGFVDLHCHLRQPGFEDKETIATGTRAAARGGFTTVCCMPNTDPPLDSRATVEYVRSTAESDGAVRVLPVGCVTKGRAGVKLADLDELSEAGVVAFSDDGKPVASSALMRRALEYSRLSGLPIVDHCEDKALSAGGLMNEGPVASKLFLRGIPAAAEERMVARDIDLARSTGGWVHVAHVSTAGSVDLIRRAKSQSVSVTADVTPHHLTLTEETVSGYNTNAKVNPPLRTEEDIAALVLGLREGVIDAVATDHAPHAARDKDCDFAAAAFGISGLETALGSLMGLVHEGKIDLVTLVSRLTLGPASLLRRPDLGTLGPGAPADVVVLAADREWVVDPNDFASKGKNTPLAGCVLKGKVMAALCGGSIAYLDQSLAEPESRETGGSSV